MIKYVIFITLLFGAVNITYSSDTLLYLEAQGVVGYSSQDKIIYRSAMKNDTMQKNSLGFDYIKKISNETSDIGMFALQTRLVYNQDEKKLEPQFYNAYLKNKTSIADIWVGHNRIAFGLASYWDTHSSLLQSLPMYGVGYDRDWGIGFSKDTMNGDIKISITSGTGMGIKTNGNWIFTSRISNGILNYDNYNIGLSFMGGKILDNVGYKIIDKTPKDIILGAIDFSYNYNNIENKAEVDFGQKDKKNLFVALYRVGFNLLDENRLKLEEQIVYTKHHDTDLHFGTGITYIITPNLTSRIMYEWQYEMKEQKIVAQVYYYFGI